MAICVFVVGLEQLAVNRIHSFSIFPHGNNSRTPLGLLQDLHLQRSQLVFKGKRTPTRTNLLTRAIGTFFLYSIIFLLCWHILKIFEQGQKSIQALPRLRRLLRMGEPAGPGLQMFITQAYAQGFC